jgi:hypothetical protein
VLNLLPNLNLEHVPHGAAGFIIPQSKTHKNCAQRAKRLEEVALPVAEVLKLVTAPELRAMVYNIRVTQPLVVSELDSMFEEMAKVL